MLYLLLNALVSALVTAGVLFVYDRFARPACSEGIGAATGVLISGVSGVGTAGSEIVTLQNNGAETVVLTGWVLMDEDGTAFTFPQLSLYPGGSIQVHTSRGDDSVTDLYWDQSASIWSGGELVLLFDTRGLARAFHRIP